MAAYRVTFVAKSLLTPHFLINLLIGEDNSFICCQQTKKFILLCCQFNFPAIPKHLSAVWANFQPRQF